MRGNAGGYCQAPTRDAPRHRPLDQFDRVEAIGVGDQRADDLPAQVSTKCGAVHVLYLVVWAAALTLCSEADV
jgi:hypothetical protein